MLPDVLLDTARDAALIVAFAAIGSAAFWLLLGPPPPPPPSP